MPRGVARIPAPFEWSKLKTCSRCGDEKPWAKFPPRRYWPDGTVRVVASHCSTCDAKLTRARQLRWREERGPQWERYEAHRRDWNRRKRRAIAQDNTAKDMRLPVGPLRVLLWEKVMEMEEPSWSDLADRCGVSDRLFRRILSEQEVTGLRHADQICTALGVHVNDLYPELEEMAA